MIGPGGQTAGNIALAPGNTGQVPAAGVSPVPGAPQTSPSVILPTKPVIGQGGQTPGNIAPAPGLTGQIPAAGVSPVPGAPQTSPSGSSPPANQPTSSSSGIWPTKSTGPDNGPEPAAPLVPVEGKVALPNLDDKFWLW